MQERSSRHQHRKQVGQMWWWDQNYTHDAQTGHGCGANVELQQTQSSYQLNENREVRSSVLSLK